MLGYTQASWDNLSGQEQQPWSSIKSWASFTDNEKAAAVVLGYSQTTWDNESGSEPQPSSFDKSWAELTACSDGEDNCIRTACPSLPALSSHLPDSRIAHIGRLV